MTERGENSPLFRKIKFRRVTSKTGSCNFPKDMLYYTCKGERTQAINKGSDLPPAHEAQKGIHYDYS